MTMIHMLLAGAGQMWANPPNQTPAPGGELP
jgi:hypothetical protein